MVKLIIDNIYIYNEDICYIKEKIRKNYCIFKLKLKITLFTSYYLQRVYKYFFNDTLFTISKVNIKNQDQIDYIYKNCYINKYIANKKGYVTIIIKNKLSKGELN